MDARPRLLQLWGGGEEKALGRPAGLGARSRLGHLGLGRERVSLRSRGAREGFPMAGTQGRDPRGPAGIGYLLGTLLAGLLSSGAAAFNLDVMGALRKEGEPGSLFGFSVALHRQLQPRPQSW